MKDIASEVSIGLSERDISLDGITVIAIIIVIAIHISAKGSRPCKSIGGQSISTKVSQGSACFFS